MPAVSKAQNRLAQARCHGKAKNTSMPKDVACEMAAKTHSTKGLPERKGKGK